MASPLQAMVSPQSPLPHNDQRLETEEVTRVPKATLALSDLHRELPELRKAITPHHYHLFSQNNMEPHQ